jgi:hypothetical protein
MDFAFVDRDADVRKPRKGQKVSFANARGATNSGIAARVPSPL